MAIPAIDYWTALIAELRPHIRVQILEFVDLKNPEPFVPFAESALATAPRGGRRSGLPKLLIDDGLLAQAISIPEVTPFEDALHLMRQALQVEPRYDVLLLQHLTDPSRTWPEAVPTGEMGRVLDLIRDTVGAQPRTSMQLRRFLKIRDPHVRSRAVKVIASSAPPFIEEFFRDNDPRVRANLLEAVLGETPKLTNALRDLLNRATFDKHHRVMTTALLYLAKSGDDVAKARLIALEKHPNEHFRIAGAWAMAKLEGKEVPGSAEAAPQPEPEPAEAVHS